MKDQSVSRDFQSNLAPSRVADRTAANLGPDGIAVLPERMRKLGPEKVEELAESIARQGQLQPIVVRPRGDDGYTLVAGRHRLEAVKRLKWPFIRATVVEGVEANAAALMECDENLVRADLTSAERALHLARRKELYEALHPETKRPAGPGRGKKNHSQNESGFVKDTAKKTGQGRSTVARDITRATNITVLADIIGTTLDQGDELDALAKLPAVEQEQLAERAKAGERVSAKPVAKKLRRDERERELAAATLAARAALGAMKPIFGVIYADSRERCRAAGKMIVILSDAS
jgi:ParB-like chromosome segregation protein Spo0J